MVSIPPPAPLDCLTFSITSCVVSGQHVYIPFVLPFEASNHSVCCHDTFHFSLIVMAIYGIIIRYDRLPFLQVIF